MHTREVTISICAAIVGVLVGSAAIGFGDVSSVEGAIIPIRTIQPGIEASARHNKGVPSESINPVAVPAVEPPKSRAPMTACEAVRAALKDVAAAEAVVPSNIENTEIIETLKKARTAIEIKYCAAEDAAKLVKSSSSSSAKAEIEIDTSACDNYPEGTMRRNMCLIRLQGRVN